MEPVVSTLWSQIRGTGVASLARRVEDLGVHLGWPARLVLGGKAKVGTRHAAAGQALQREDPRRTFGGLDWLTLDWWR